MKDVSLPSIPERHDPMSFEEAIDGTCYMVRYMQLQQRLFSRMANVFTFTSLFGGSAAFAGVITEHTVLTATSGVIVAVSTMLDFVIDPKKHAAQCRKARRRFQRLYMKKAAYSFEEYECETCRIALIDFPDIEGLRRPAFNDTCVQLGRTKGVVVLNKWERFLKLIT
ncbi:MULTISPECIES: hypothetical protein [Halomonadaceae]|jgi:hypothetical protein|uniref:Uncharacterized protein n=1 Tax=Vreelandella titanicae TaxID=664683 RepID=A0AAP9NKM0_9GAMM|nr:MULTISPECIES: hypothetical protein [Halomonas]QKS23551.1 hypothetical protein FX987_01310 [Halomonas titanicae]CDG55210.1 hypothetical protein HALA3H3_880027 [Halomonas sp. A3H3]SDI36474.1 hypothetical protein SAMN04487867_10588 [Halomonas titanicae]|tara:strand:- start:25 stop:528 length:504 start_codon:yes stop_codon:yes gene_type:complete